MYRALYESYKKQVFVLAKTLIVKHEEIAQSTNREAFWSGHFDEVLHSDPRTWRYYKNLAGEYHQYDIDYLLENYGTPYMTVQIPVVNGSKEVAFTKDLFNGESADVSLANEFAMGSKLYNDIVNRYPELEALIIGILNPVDMEVAISARNGEILHIDGFYKTINPATGVREFTTRINKNYNVLIEPQEHNLIDKLQTYIYNYIDHWVNAEYIVGNDLYTITTIGILYMQLPHVIMNIRLGNCRTTYAHTFHIKCYLESFGLLGRYVDFIPIESSLWLYRNTMFHEANRGKHLNFDAILKNLWTPNRIPLNAYSIRHHLSGMGQDNLLPHGMLYKEVLNFSVPGISDDDRTVRDILEAQVPLARENHKDLDDKEAKIQTMLNWGGDDRLQTKVLESEMMDLGDPFPFSLDYMLINHWGWTAHKGYYTGTIYVDHPMSNDRIGLTPLNAYILAVYCLNIGVADNKMETIPSMYFYDIPRTNDPYDLPTDEFFYPKPDLEKAYSWVDHTHTRKRKVEEVLGTHTPKFRATNKNSFYTNTYENYQERIRKYYAKCSTEDYKERGDLHLVMGRCYWQGFKEQLAEGSYEEWLRLLGINFDEFEKEDYLKLGLELVAEATGVDANKNSRRKWLQKAMIAILKHFISYTVHIIEKYADGIVNYLGFPTVRFSNMEWTYAGMATLYHQLYLDYDARIKIKQTASIRIPNIFDEDRFRVNVSPGVKVTYDVGDLRIKLGREIKRVGHWDLNLSVFNLGFIERTKEYLPFPDAPPDYPLYEDSAYKSGLYPITINGDNENSIDLLPSRVTATVVPVITRHNWNHSDRAAVTPALISDVDIVNASIEYNLEQSGVEKVELTPASTMSATLTPDVRNINLEQSGIEAANVIPSLISKPLIVLDRRDYELEQSGVDAAQITPSSNITTTLTRVPENYNVTSVDGADVIPSLIATSFAAPPLKFAIYDEAESGGIFDFNATMKFVGPNTYISTNVVVATEAEKGSIKEIVEPGGIVDFNATMNYVGPTMSISYNTVGVPKDTIKEVVESGGIVDFNATVRFHNPNISIVEGDGTGSGT